MKPIQTVAVSVINNMPYLTFACDYLVFTGEMEDYKISSDYDMATLKRIPTIEICKLRCQSNKDCSAYTFDRAKNLCVLKRAKFFNLQDFKLTLIAGDKFCKGKYEGECM